MSDLLDSDSLYRLTNRMIYHSISEFPAPRVATDAIMVNYKIIWRRLRAVSDILSSQEYECLFLLIHNKLPIPERLHRIGMKENPMCNTCPGIVSDLSHYFCTCTRTNVVWSWLGSKITNQCFQCSTSF